MAHNRRADRGPDRSVDAQRVLGAILVIMALASVVLVAVQTYRLDRVITCQVAYNEAFAASLEMRAAAAAEERQAQRQLLQTLLRFRPTDDSPERAQAREQALSDYIAGLNAADAARQSAPLPDQDCTADLTLTTR